MDISSLRETRARSELTVSELNSYVKSLIDGDRTLNAVSVRGEISNFTYHRTGHLYFSLKDEGGQVKAVMFRSSAASLKFMPENGMKVIVRCSVSVYTPGGSYQLYVTSMQPDGIGALYLAYEQLKARLEAEGLFSPEFKRPIPIYPTRIGVITSPTGAAVRDIINVTSRRYPLATIYLYPSLVQGESAEDNLIEALDYFEKSGLADVIIIGRGGGSIEDLWAFNGERLARKIFASTTPIISAVGHETDFTICDFVADLRAPTPSAAAEIAVPDMRELRERISDIYDRCEAALNRAVERRADRLFSIKERAIYKRPGALIEMGADSLDRAREALFTAIEKRLTNEEHRVELVSGKLDMLSPLKILSRGYSVATQEGGLIKSTDSVAIGSLMDVRVSDGVLRAQIVEKRKNEDGR
ncbi:MAG: exodeoxyribonuclease VII large subunit [Ruminococcaceae bacterium]|nr:exodeoxyribonuclease VII large subunit [Oscillospiraceae bacterium]